MAEEFFNSEWRKQNETIKYPFSSKSSLVNDAGMTIFEGVFVDASLYAIGGKDGTYISRIEVSFQTVTIWIGDSEEKFRASGTFSLVSMPEEVALLDAFDRPAGVLVSADARLNIFQSWAVGAYDFKSSQTEFAATVCIPTPEVGVRGFILEDGSFFAADVWLIGEDGVVLTTDVVMVPQRSGESKPYNVIRVDIVGDPLFRRRLCVPVDLFESPNFIKQIRVIHTGGEFFCSPDEFGNINLSTSNQGTPNNPLRIRNTGNGVVIEMAGKSQI